ncbi:Macrolide export protein MacA [Burkholderiales bacterium]|jgi:RND family efflux transporter MFP subunit|nr:Macrolide export protein MacA [Burkholderiales bacterium]
MKPLALSARSLKLLAVLLPLAGLFVYTALRSGPLAPVPVQLADVEDVAIAPRRFGVGTVEASASFQIGPTVAGRLKRLEVNVGDRVRAGQVLGEMDPIDFDERLRAQEAALLRAAAQWQEANARRAHAERQANRYEQLFANGAVTEEMRASKLQDLRLALAQQAAVTEDQARLRAERDATRAQRANLRLVAPAEGLVAARRAEPGTTLVAGQAALTLVDPKSLWINARFDQAQSGGLAPGQKATITLRSRAGLSLAGQVLRLEPLADAVTEETLAKVVFAPLPEPPPAIGELAELTVQLPPRPSAPSIPNAALSRFEGKLGVWQLAGDELKFTAVQVGDADLEGRVEVREGLRRGDRVIVYSAKPLHSGSRVTVVERVLAPGP